jgi:hypothetical protein
MEKIMFDFNSIDKEECISRADGFQGRQDEALEYLDDRIDELKSHMESGTVRLQRVVFAKDEKSINRDNLGNHWCDEDDLINEDHMLDYLKHECSGETIEGDVILLETEFSVDDIDFDMTIAQNLLNPDENEIFIKSGAKPVSTLWVDNLTQETGMKNILDAVQDLGPVYVNELAEYLQEFMDKHNMSDNNYMEVLSHIDWFSSDYDDTKEGYFKEIDETISHRKMVFNGGEQTLPFLIDSLMNAYKLSEKEFLDAHDSIDWHGSCAENVSQWVKEIEISSRREPETSFSL